MSGVGTRNDGSKFGIRVLPIVVMINDDHKWRDGARASLVCGLPIWIEGLFALVWAPGMMVPNLEFACY